MATRPFTTIGTNFVLDRPFATGVNVGDFTLGDFGALRPVFDLGDVVAPPGRTPPSPAPGTPTRAQLPRVRPGDLITAELCNLLLGLVEQLLDRVAALEPLTARVTALEPLVARVTTLEPLAARVTAVERRVTTLEQPPASPPTGTGPTPGGGAGPFPGGGVLDVVALAGGGFTVGDVTGGGGFATPGGFTRELALPFLAVAVPAIDPATGVTSFTLHRVVAATGGSGGGAGGSGATGGETSRGVREVPGIGEARANRLAEAGIGDLSALAAAPQERVAEALELTEDRAAELIAEASRLLAEG